MSFSKTRFKKVAPVIFLPIFFFAILFLVEKATRHKTQFSDQKGQAIGNFELVDLKTKEKISLSQYKGKVLLINFWASWCEACMEEMPSIVKLYNALNPKGFEVISINVDEDPSKTVPQVIKEFDMNFKIYRDPEQKIAEAFQVVAIPYSIIVGRDFKIQWSESGERDWASQEILTEFQQLLEKSI